MAEDATNLKKIEEIVVLMLENQAFDHMLATSSINESGGPLGSWTREE
jgi:phospholipase C